MKNKLIPCVRLRGGGRGGGYVLVRRRGWGGSRRHIRSPTVGDVEAKVVVRVESVHGARDFIWLL